MIINCLTCLPFLPSSLLENTVVDQYEATKDDDGSE
jgi:hypothetical protein